MTNSKIKSTPRNRLQKLADEVLFMRSFHYTIEGSPDDIHDQLNDLSYQPGKLTRVFFPRRRIVTVEKIDTHHHAFTIKSKLGGLYTELNTRGHILYDENTDMSHIQGEVKFDAVYLTVLLAGLFFLITWAIASLTHAGSLPSPFIFFTLGLTNLFYFRQMFLDRNDLLKTLDQTLPDRDITSARKRLADTATTPQNLHSQSIDRPSSATEVS